MTIALTLTRLRAPEHPGALLIVGPSLGTAVTPLWSACVEQLPADVGVIGWDLPGHGRSAPHEKPFTIGDLAEAVLEATELERSEATGPIAYAGVSIGGAVGLALAIDHADDLQGVAVICSGAKIGEADAWHERADLVRQAGTPVMVEGSAQRWFAPGAIERDPAITTALLDSLQQADRFSYARCCEALADFDVRDDLDRVRIPVLALAGEHDAVATLAMAREIADGTGGRAEQVDGVAHLAPAEAPADVARTLGEFLRGPVAEAAR
jgi:3-oxoadipate enol-lactonase